MASINVLSTLMPESVELWPSLTLKFMVKVWAVPATPLTVRGVYVNVIVPSLAVVLATAAFDVNSPVFASMV